MDFLAGVKQGGKHLILKRLGLEKFFSGPVCDRERKPYSPSVDGWNNGICLLNFTNLKCLELRNICIVLKSYQVNLGFYDRKYSFTWQHLAEPVKLLL